MLAAAWVLAMAAAASAQTVALPPHAPRALAGRLAPAAELLASGSPSIACVTLPGTGRTPGFNPNHEARLTQQIGPAYASSYQVCVDAAGRRVPPTSRPPGTSVIIGAIALPLP